MKNVKKAIPVILIPALSALLPSSCAITDMLIIIYA